MDGVFLSSCVGYHVREEDKKVIEYLMIGTSLGEIIKFTITKNNSVIHESKNVYNEDHPITSMCSDPATGTLLAGTSGDHIIHVQLGAAQTEMNVIRSHTKQNESMVTSIKLMNQAPLASFYVVGLATGVVRIYSCASCDLVVEMMAHSRQVNAIVCHEVKPVFATVSDDTMVNLWHAKIEKDTITDIELVHNQRIPDHLLVGVVFGAKQDSLLVAPYDYKFLIHMKNLC